MTSARKDTDAFQDSVPDPPEPLPMLALAFADATLRAAGLSAQEYADVASGQWVNRRAGRFITEWDDMQLKERLTSGDMLDTIDEEDRRWSERLHNMSKISIGFRKGKLKKVRSHLLYEAQGSDKSALARDWCHHIKGTLIELDSRAAGPLQGQTEQKTKHLVQKAIDIGKSSPVILLIDKADDFLWCSGSDRLTVIQSCIKIVIGDLLKADSKVWLIALADNSMHSHAQRDWNWRLSKKIRVKLPGVKMRAAVISKGIEGFGVAVSAVEVERCAMRLEGYRFYDMIDIVGLLEWTVRKPANRSTKVSRWRRSTDAEGRIVLTRPALGDTADFVCSCEGLSEKSGVSWV